MIIFSTNEERDELPVSTDEPAANKLLTAPEQVLVKDIWNKFLAFQDMLIELFFERLLHEEPGLRERFGDAIDEMPGYFAELFDAGVRQLMPHTERILRESYRGIYPEQSTQKRTIEASVTLLADLGMRPSHWLTARRVWTWTLLQVPHLEEYDRENLALGTLSAPYRFFSQHILPLALQAIDDYDKALTPAMIRAMRHDGDRLAAKPLAIGVDFYRALFETHPDILPYFVRTDIDTLAQHLMQSIAFLVQSLETGHDVMAELRELARVHTNHRVPPDAYGKLIEPMLRVMKQHIPNFSLQREQAWQRLLTRVSHVLQQPIVNQQRTIRQAREFIGQIAAELDWEAAKTERRLAEIEREIHATGTYTHTFDELSYGAQLAWRNSSKCIGRIAWRNLIVRDLRHVTDPDEIFRECAEHMRLATNGGNMQIVMNVFRPKQPQEHWGPRIWNSQYVRFAAYELEDGSVLGDQANLALTKALIRQGWVPPAQKTAFDYLPLVIDVPGHLPRMYEFEPDDVLMVPIEHPFYPEFDALKLQWCAIPAITNFRMEIGGISYGCVPFNGWFMETEIARNLWEEGRYNKAEFIARTMGLDTSTEQTLWRDRAFLELNVAVLHSFSKAKVTLVDHQTASRQFIAHDQREKRAGRECPAQWSWVTPAAGGSSTSVWHHEMRDFYLSPNFHYAADRWAVIDNELTVAGEDTCPETWAGAIPQPNGHTPTTVSRARPKRVLILYGSETGTAESYARQAARRLNRHRPRVMALDDYSPASLGEESTVLVVVSTFGNGEPPGNAMAFVDQVRHIPTNSLRGFDFSVMALGSTVYPHFCAAGATIDRELARIGGKRTTIMHRGDEIRGQADTFRQWLDIVTRLLGDSRPHTNETSSDDWHLTVTLLAPEQVTLAQKTNAQNHLPGVVIPVLANRELLSELVPNSRSTRFLAFDIRQTGLTYETGDHVAIYPHNPADLVERISQRLGIDADAWFMTAPANNEGASSSGDHPYPQPASVRQVLTEELDLALREPFDELINLMAQQAEAPPERTRLTDWADTLALGDQHDACTGLKAHLQESYATIADLLDAFPSVRVSFGQLLEVLPKQRPRLYSISSCPATYPDQMHVTVGVIQVVSLSGQVRPGLCSNYLAGLSPEQKATVRLSVRTSGFRPPQRPDAPMILVGPGTGLSPFIGFLQYREWQLRTLALSGESVTSASARLYFGCRNQHDYLYQQELEHWEQIGLLTHLSVAFSRVGPQKTYVQHLIGQHHPDVWAMLKQPDCHVYICGDARMADEVMATFMTIARTTGHLTHADAVEFFRLMEQQNRFQTDVWGVLHHFRQSLAEVQEARYAQSERWLAQVNGSAARPVPESDTRLWSE
ncbi:nitric oxide synthase oxygenase [Spirosoma montaniterrae]|uniref:nitric oxide synthase oxygenase n=1 Tax=Spirosoma montaniterrae TaxID=1178516 RepID=UPI0012F93D66|nr:nitric oxide synthase oxygenase [Spirosoma montaniterrae]